MLEPIMELVLSYWYILINGLRKKTQRAKNDITNSVTIIFCFYNTSKENMHNISNNQQINAYLRHVIVFRGALSENI